MSEREYLFTSESVTEGHPDKMCDAISDAVLDAIIAGRDRRRAAAASAGASRRATCACACESFTTTGLVVVGGEIRTHAYVDIHQHRARGRHGDRLQPRQVRLRRRDVRRACSASTSRAPTSRRASTSPSRSSTARAPTRSTWSAPATRA